MQSIQSTQSARRVIPIAPAAIHAPRVFNVKTARLSLKPVDFDYTQPSATRRIPIEFRGRTIYISDLLTRGNHKLARDVYIFDLLPIATCPNCRDCRRGCYAVKDNRYPSVFNRRLILTEIARDNLDLLKALIVQSLRCALEKRRDASRRLIVRIHSAGDFFSVNYAAAWVEIAEKFAGFVDFYTYSKSPYAPYGAASNLNIVQSVAPDGAPNFGTLEEITRRAAATPGAFVCGYGVPGRESEKCCVNCFECLHRAHVFFKQH